MKKTKKTKTTAVKPSSAKVLYIEESGPSIFDVAHYMHHTIARRCEYCNRPMTPSDENDYGTLCMNCYIKEYC